MTLITTSIPPAVYRQMRYKKGEKEKMIRAGFPLCVGKTHCNTCIKRFRDKYNKKY